MIKVFDFFSDVREFTLFFLADVLNHTARVEKADGFNLFYIHLYFT